MNKPHEIVSYVRISFRFEGEYGYVRRTGIIRDGRPVFRCTLNGMFFGPEFFDTPGAAERIVRWLKKTGHKSVYIRTDTRVRKAPEGEVS